MLCSNLNVKTIDDMAWCGEVGGNPVDAGLHPTASHGGISAEENEHPRRNTTKGGEIVERPK